MATPDETGMFLALVESAPDGVVITDRAGRITLVNEQAERIFGWSRDDLIGQSVDVLIPESVRPNHTTYRGRYWGKPQTRPMGSGLDLLAVRKDGAEIAVDISLSPVDTETGTVVMAIVRDVTDRRREQHRMSKLAAIVASSADAIYSTDATGVITSWNTSAERLYGYPAGSAIGMSSTRLAAAHCQAQWEDVMARVFAGEHVHHFETEHVRSDGLVFPVMVSVASTRGHRGEIIELAVISRDITEQRTAQETLAESERRLLETEALAHVGGWLWDKASGVVQWTDELHRICGVDPIEFEGTFNAHVATAHPDDRTLLVNCLDVAVRDGTSVDVEHRVQRPSGEVRWVHVRANPVLGPGRVPVGLRGVVHDITERHASEEAIRIAYERERDAAAELRQADHLKDEFLATVSHELRTPLTAIIGFASLLPRQSANPELRADLEVRISRNAAEMERMIERLLDFSRLEAGRVAVHPARTRLASAVGAAIEALAGVVADNPVDMRIDEKLMVMVDGHALSHIVRNLVSNAAKFSPASEPIEITAEADDSEVVLAVRDHGPGVPEGLEKQVFDRFFQAPDQPSGKRGTGVGLAIVQRYAELSDGRVWCEQAQGGGAVFKCILPRAMEQA